MLFSVLNAFLIGSIVNLIMGKTNWLFVHGLNWHKTEKFQTELKQGLQPEGLQFYKEVLLSASLEIHMCAGALKI